MTTVIPPADHHDCALPWKSSGFGTTGVLTGTLARCDVCGQWWHSAPCFESYGPTDVWRKVRWYHWRLRRRARHEADTR